MSSHGAPSRYRTADGRYLPGADSPALAARKDRVLGRLTRVHEKLSAFQDAHNATRYGCLRAGQCCRVGLVLHTAEIEHVHRGLERRFVDDPAARGRVIAALEHALSDRAWTMGEGIGDLMCAFYADGCTIYPFRPAVCRMYGVVLELNDDCPRRRLASGREFVWIDPAADRAVRELYRAVDDYGALFPRADCSRYLAAGLLMFMLPQEEVAAIRARTPAKFWRTLHGYRGQFVPSRQKEAYDGRVPRFPVRLRVPESRA